MELIEIGKITKPQALKGQVRVKLYSNDFNVLNNVKKVYLNNAPVVLLNATDRNTFCVLTLEGITTIDQAESLRDTNVFILKSDLKLKSTDYLVSDLVGYSVVNQLGHVVGQLKQIDNYGAADIYVVLLPNGKELMFANAGNIIKSTDAEKKQIVVNQKVLDQMGVLN